MSMTPKLVDRHLHAFAVLCCAATTFISIGGILAGDGTELRIPLQSEAKSGSLTRPGQTRQSHGVARLFLPDGWSESDPVRFQYYGDWKLPTIETASGEVIGLAFVQAPRQSAVHDVANVPVRDLRKKQWTLVAVDEWKDKGDGYYSRGVVKLFHLKQENKLMLAGFVDLRSIAVSMTGELESDESFEAAVQMFRGLRVE